MNQRYDHQLPIMRATLALSLLSKLEECGFQEKTKPTMQGMRILRAKSAEKVYFRNVTPDGKLRIEVYTTVVGGGVRPIEVRRNGTDAIRVCGVYTTKDGGRKGITKETRINRTGDIENIVERMYQRMRNAWKSTATGEKCRSCGAPKFVAKSGSKVCAEICWKTDDEKAADNVQWQKESRRKKTKVRRRWHR